MCFRINVTFGILLFFGGAPGRFKNQRQKSVSVESSNIGTLPVGVMNMNFFYKRYRMYIHVVFNVYYISS